jgi:hypothetical protein
MIDRSLDFIGRIAFLGIYGLALFAGIDLLALPFINWFFAFWQPLQTVLSIAAIAIAVWMFIEGCKVAFPRS